MPDLLATDSLTYVLGFTAAAAFLLNAWLTPQSLVHPILLGRQSDVERVRQKGESAVYRNYGTGAMGRLPIRPAGNVLTLLDFVKPDFSGSRTLWSTKITNEKLRARVSALGAGLIRVAGLQPKESNVLLLLNDSIDLLVTDLALASQSIPSFTLSSLTLLSSVLDSHPPSAIILHVHFLNTVLELIAENREYTHHTLILVGEGDLPKVVEKVQVKILWLADLERKGAKEECLSDYAPAAEDVFSVFFYPGPNNELKATQLTHQNLTAGVTATRALLPLNGAISPSDSIVSSHSLSTPYGRAVAYTALYEGSSFSTTDSTVLFPKDEASLKMDNNILESIRPEFPPATILYLTPVQMDAIASLIVSLAKKTLYFPLAWRHKLFHLQQGYLGKDSMWDRWAFSNPQKTVLGTSCEALRAIVVSGGLLEESILIPARIGLSVPLVNAHEHPLVAGPIFASHPLDFQAFPPSSPTPDKEPTFIRAAHVGPPSINVEVKLAGVDDYAVESGADPKGEVVVRGPSVTLPLEEGSTPHGWVHTGERGLVQSNGTFKVLPTPRFFSSHI